MNEISKKLKTFLAACLPKFHVFTDSLCKVSIRGSLVRAKSQSTWYLFEKINTQLLKKVCKDDVNSKQSRQ